MEHLINTKIKTRFLVIKAYNHFLYSYKTPIFLNKKNTLDKEKCNQNAVFL